MNVNTVNCLRRWLKRTTEIAPAAGTVIATPVATDVASEKMHDVVVIYDETDYGDGPYWTLLVRLAEPSYAYAASCTLTYNIGRMPDGTLIKQIALPAAATAVEVVAIVGSNFGTGPTGESYALSRITVTWTDGARELTRLRDFP